MTDHLNGKEIRLREFANVLKTWILIFVNQWILIVALGIVGAILGYYNAYKAKPKYIAVLTFTLDEKSGGGGLSGIASQFGLNLLGSEGGGVFSGDNNIELIRSRKIIENSLLTPVEIDGKVDLLVNRYLVFTEFYEEFKDKPEVQQELVFRVGQGRERFSRAKDSLLFRLYRDFSGNIKVDKADKRLNIYKIQFVSGDELFSKLFTEALVKNVSTLYIETKTKNYKANVMILSHRLDSVRTALNRDITGHATTIDQNMNIIRAQGGVQSSKRQLSVDVLTTTYSELVKNLEVAQYVLLREEPIIQVIDSPILPLDKNAPSKLRGLILGGIIGVYVGLVLIILISIKRRYW